jgi:hypothetical protein
MTPDPVTHRSRSLAWRKPVAITAALAVLAVVVACLPAPAPTEAPPASPTPVLPVHDAACPPSVLLANSAEVFLKSDARLDVLTLADPVLSLASGEIVVNSILPAQRVVGVRAPNGFLAQLSGQTMIVAYEGQGGQFTLACVAGVCRIGPDADHLTTLAADTQASLDEDGNYLGPFAISLQNISADCENILVPTPVPTDTPTATPEPGITPDLAGTATAACKQFHEQYPLTPTCP